MEEDRLTKEQVFNDSLLKNLAESCNKSLLLCNALYEYAKHFNLLDTQLFIQWQDSLNEISVRYDSRDSTSQNNVE